MLLRYFYHQPLAHASYLVGCQAAGEAIVIDPGRDVKPYLAAAEAQGVRIVATAETHIHADFLSGARELAERAGATLYLSGEGDAIGKYKYPDKYGHVLLRDGDTFKVGNIHFEAMYTPGHTAEHLSYIVTDAASADRPMGVFTGDFVFVSDVGRPDLAERAVNLSGTAQTQARQAFRSLQRFKQHPDYSQVWPAHGAGSACGRDLGAVPSTTVGYEKLFNWAFSHTDEDAFVQALLEGQPEPPKYFAVMNRMNREGPRLLRSVPTPERLPCSRLLGLLAEGATVVDTRPATAFATAHVPGTVNIPHDNSFVNWAGWLLDYEQPFYLMGDPRGLERVLKDLRYIGLDDVAGYFEPPNLDAWVEACQPVQSYRTTTATQAAQQILREEAVVIDVRSAAEWAEGHIPGARHIMLGYLPDRIYEIPKDRPVIVQCQTGNRSAIGASVLKAHGFSQVINMMGGFHDWVMADLPVDDGTAR